MVDLDEGDAVCAGGGGYGNVWHCYMHGGDLEEFVGGGLSWHPVRWEVVVIGWTVPCGEFEGGREVVDTQRFSKLV